MGTGGGQSVRTCCVCVDADGGRGCLGSRTHCVCMQMDCVQTQISVNKKTKQKKLTGEKGWWAERADLLRVCGCGRGCLGSRTRCVCMQMDCVRTRMSVRKKRRKNLLVDWGR